MESPVTGQLDCALVALHGLPVAPASPLHTNLAASFAHDGYRLISGFHRLEAMRRLGRTSMTKATPKYERFAWG